MIAVRVMLACIVVPFTAALQLPVVGGRAAAHAGHRCALPHMEAASQEVVRCALIGLSAEDPLRLAKVREIASRWGAMPPLAPCLLCLFGLTLSAFLLARPWHPTPSP